MSNNTIDRTGQFQALITEYGLREQESGAVGVSIKARLTAMWNQDADAWDEWGQYEMDAYGDVWVVKKDGTLNKPAVQSLVNHAGWDGDLTSIAQSTWQPTPCQVSIQENEYKGSVSYRIAFVNDFSRAPGGMGNIDEAKVKALQARFGGELRALAGNVARNAPKATNGKPPAPKPAVRQAQETDPNEDALNLEITRLAEINELNALTKRRTAVPGELGIGGDLLVRWSNACVERADQIRAGRGPRTAQRETVLPDRPAHHGGDVPF